MKIDLAINFLSEKQKALIPNLRVEMREHYSIDFCNLLKIIWEMDYPVEGKMVYYYSPKKQLHIFCGLYPLPPGSIIPLQDIEKAEGRLQVFSNFYNLELRVFRLKLA